MNRNKRQGYILQIREDLEALATVHQELIHGMQVHSALLDIRSIYTSIESLANQLNCSQLLEVAQNVARVTTMVIKGEKSLSAKILDLIIKARAAAVAAVNRLEFDLDEQSNQTIGFLKLAQAI